MRGERCLPERAGAGRAVSQEVRADGVSGGITHGGNGLEPASMGACHHGAPA